MSMIVKQPLKQSLIPTGRFAPSPSGRMHLGNVFTAVLSWLSVRSRGGRWILRIEDLDPQRSKAEHARRIEDDLLWLGLDWDEGGLDDRGEHGPYSQSRRLQLYEAAFERLVAQGLVYNCRCRRADIMATQAPHQSYGRIVYAGTCRPQAAPPFGTSVKSGVAARLYVPDCTIDFTDEIYGPQSVEPARHCGDFVLRRADGAWAYQLAVVVDDALMGVTEVMRGSDLLLSSAQQIYLYRLLGYEPPVFAHVPLVCNGAGVRLSKRDEGVSMEDLRRRYTPAELLGLIARMAGLAPDASPKTLAQLKTLYDKELIPHDDTIGI